MDEGKHSFFTFKNIGFLVLAGLFVIIIGASLTYFIYQDIRQELISHLTAREESHVRQMARGIELYFRDCIAAAERMARQESVARIDERGRQLLADFQGIYTDTVSI
ncbi:MAG: hypothetical protein N2Z74_02145, partial [Syntrophales bacterium]|nr:hypothetical protein [Syntrophales bacterium]